MLSFYSLVDLPSGFTQGVYGLVLTYTCKKGMMHFVYTCRCKIAFAHNIAALHYVMYFTDM